MSPTDSPPPPLHDPDGDRAAALRAVRRIHRTRTLGLALGAICVAVVLHQNGDGPGWWFLLALHAFVWPQLALWRSLRSAAPRRTEAANLLLDSALGGAWIAVMQCNLLPSVLLLTMLTVDKVDVGRPRVLVRGTALTAASFVVTWTLLGFPLNVASPMTVILGCLPLLIVYPLATSAISNALARRVAAQNRKLEALGRTDVLTGLANRGWAFAVAEAEFARCRRTGRAASLLILDVDNFKTINDRHGHPLGDAVLCSLAAILREETRAVDTAARYGGDEFMMVMPETPVAGARELARRIRQRLAAVELPGTPGLRFTVSIGAAEASSALTDVESWISHADKALYQAKAQGRDRFVGADAGAPLTMPQAAG